MATITNLAMSKDLAKDERISIKKAFFGLSTKAFYTGTNSALKASKTEYTQEVGSKMTRALSATPDKCAEQFAALGKQPSTTLGNYLLEECHSADGNFAALQLFQYSHMNYQPVTGVCFFEGNDAQAVIACL